jgi:hypothetical protein
MDGLLTRLYSHSQPCMLPDNLNQSDLYRLVPLDTRHLGSISQIFWWQCRSTPDRKHGTGLTGESITAGAVCDLSENRPAVAGLRCGTALKSQVITANRMPGRPPGTASFWPGVGGFLHPGPSRTR